MASIAFAPTEVIEQAAFSRHCTLVVNGTKLPFEVGQSMSALPRTSDVDLFRYSDCIVNLDPEVPDGALDSGVAEQELNGPQIARAPID